MRLALDGGEIDIICSALTTYRTTMEPTGRYVPILQSDQRADLLAAGVPSAALLAQDAHGRALLELADAFRVTDRFYVAPPDTPPAVLGMLRLAFDATMRDEAFVAAARRAHLDIAPIAPDQIARRLSTVLDIAPEKRQALKDLIAAESLP